jgi:hypothetical protein
MWGGYFDDSSSDEDGYEDELHYRYSPQPYYNPPTNLTAQASSLMQNLLRYSKEAYLKDPNFEAGVKRYRPLMRALLSVHRTCRPLEEQELPPVKKYKSANAPSLGSPVHCGCISGAFT